MQLYDSRLNTEKNARILRNTMRKGSKMTPEQCRNVSLALRNSEKFQKMIVERNKKYRYRCPRVQKASHPRHSASVAESLRVKAEIEKKLGVHCILITAARMKRMVTESPTHQVLCHRCTELLKIGDIVVPKGNQRYGKRKRRRKYYHADCWESLFIEVED